MRYPSHRMSMGHSAIVISASSAGRAPPAMNGLSTISGSSQTLNARSVCRTDSDQQGGGDRRCTMLPQASFGRSRRMAMASFACGWHRYIRLLSAWTLRSCSLALDYASRCGAGSRSEVLVSKEQILCKTFTRSAPRASIACWTGCASSRFCTLAVLNSGTIRSRSLCTQCFSQSHSARNCFCSRQCCTWSASAAGSVSDALWQRKCGTGFTTL